MIYNAINIAETPDQLDGLAREVARHWGEGELSDDEAMVLDEEIACRRPFRHCNATLPPIGVMLGRLNGRIGSLFKSRQRPRSPDRQASRERRRTLGGSSALPDTLRHHYTEGQRAVLCIVAGEVKDHGICDLPYGKIAALAGVCHTTVQTTIHEALRLGHIWREERPQKGAHGKKIAPNRTNVIEITSPEWRTWIKRGPSARCDTRGGSNFEILVSATKSKEINRRPPGQADRPKGALERGLGPPLVHSLRARGRP